jgi:hypothetical protein
LPSPVGEETRLAATALAGRPLSTAIASATEVIEAP